MSSLVFEVTRSKAVVVQPARPTPIEVKSLSDWDNQTILRHPMSVIMLYKHSEATDKDPADTIKKALAEALVYYYPWAGRLKDGPDGKLVVDCTAEGVVFVDADADVRLDQLQEESLQPPFPCLEGLLYREDPAAAYAIPTLGSPLFSMQVTRMVCGGFLLAFTFDHVISDGFGAAMFLTAISELAGGAPCPSVRPIWQRELLNARDSLQPPTTDMFQNPLAPMAHERNGDQDGTYGSFFFGPGEVASIRARVPHNLRDSYTSFELIVGCVLHCRVTSTLQHSSEEQVRVAFTVNCRNKFVDPPIPAGYYGNVSFNAMFACPMHKLNDLGFAVEEVKKAKEAVNQDYVRSMLDIEVIRRRVPATNKPLNLPSFFFSDLSRVGFSTLDFGSWGRPVFVGLPGNPKFRRAVFMAPFTNQKGDEGRLLNIYMPTDAMDRFSTTLNSLLQSN